MVYQVPGAQCAAVAWQDSGVVDAGGKGSYRVGEVIFWRKSPSCRRCPTELLFDFSRLRSRGFVAAGVALGRSGGDRTRKDVPSDQGVLRRKVRCSSSMICRRPAARGVG